LKKTIAPGVLTFEENLKSAEIKEESTDFTNNNRDRHRRRLH
jgi:hypothetical protein